MALASEFPGLAPITMKFQAKLRNKLGTEETGKLVFLFKVLNAREGIEDEVPSFCD